jgi:hypothetical protein
MFLEEVSDQVWLKIRDRLPMTENSDRYYFELQKAIKTGISGHVNKYPNCGLTEACHDEIEGSPLMDYSEKIYMLSVDNELDGFIGDIAELAFNSIIDESAVGEQSELLSMISATLRHEFGKCLYFNPVCRTIPFCQLQLD